MPRASTFLGRPHPGAQHRSTQEGGSPAASAAGTRVGTGMAAGVVLADGVTSGARPNGRVAPETARWRVLLTKSRQEKAAAETLPAAGIEHYLPLTRRIRYYGARKFKVEAPLFPGYLFLRGTTEDWYFAARTRRVAQVIGVQAQASVAR